MSERVVTELACDYGRALGLGGVKLDGEDAVACLAKIATNRPEATVEGLRDYAAAGGWVRLGDGRDICETHRHLFEG